MQFAESHILLGLWGILILIAFYLWAQKRYKSRLRRFAQEHLLKDIASDLLVSRMFWKKVLIAGVFVFSIVALSRPQWGFRWQEIKRQGLDILVVIDTSKSMLTQDVKPNRLERTKLAVKDLLKKLKGDRIGLVAFAGEAFLMCPLTVDYNGFLYSLNDLSVNTIPRGGTDISQAIAQALEGYKETPNKYKAIIIITDGDNLEGDPVAMAKKAKDEGIKIYTIGIGTKEGELIQVRNARGELEFIKDPQGNVVQSKLNERLLQQIALTTGGLYVKASGAQFGLDLIYERDMAKLEKREIESKMEKKFTERFQIPLGLALLLLVVETCLSTRKK